MLINVKTVVEIIQIIACTGLLKRYHCSGYSLWPYHTSLPRLVIFMPQTVWNACSLFIVYGINTIPHHNFKLVGTVGLGWRSGRIRPTVRPVPVVPTVMHGTLAHVSRSALYFFFTLVARLLRMQFLALSAFCSFAFAVCRLPYSVFSYTFSVAVTCGGCAEFRIVLWHTSNPF